MASPSTRAPMARHATGQGRVRRGYRIDGRDDELTSEFARDMLIDNLVELRRALRRIGSLAGFREKGEGAS